MARNQSPLTNWSQYLALRTIAGVVRCFDVNQNLHTAAQIGSAFYHVNPKRRARAEQNIQRAFPEWDEPRVRDCAKRSMQYMFRLAMVDALVMPRLIRPDNWNTHIELGDISAVVDRLLNREPALFITGHCGNWELLGYTLATLGFPIAALARPIDNPLINDWLLGIREASGMRIITKWGATKELQATLDRGGQIGFIADQNAGDGGLYVPFFNRLASSYKSIALLAMRYDVPVIAGVAHRVGEQFRYRLDITDIITPDAWADQPDPLFYITARYNRAIELMIRRHPEQYLWLHRRWKSRPKFERQGKPLPDRLRAKLEALPWITARDLEQIEANSRAN